MRERCRLKLDLIYGARQSLDSTSLRSTDRLGNDRQVILIEYMKPPLSTLLVVRLLVRDVDQFAEFSARVSLRCMAPTYML